jgi:hypothetical protein
VLANGEGLAWLQCRNSASTLAFPILYRLFEENLIVGNNGFKEVYV